MSPARQPRLQRRVGLAVAAALILVPSALLAGDPGPWKGFALGVITTGMLLAILVG